jgi:putative transcriptional regulator
MINRVRALRAERGWSQGELGKALSVSRQTVNAIEAGRYDPSLPLAFRIAAVFGLRIEEIFAGSAGGDVPSPPDPPSRQASTKASS